MDQIIHISVLLAEQIPAFKTLNDYEDMVKFFYFLRAPDIRAVGGPYVAGVTVLSTGIFQMFLSPATSRGHAPTGKK